MKYVTSERNGVLKNELLAIGGKLNELENTILFSQNEIIDSNLISIIVEGDT
jgi:hypothetical protein